MGVRATPRRLLLLAFVLLGLPGCASLPAPDYAGQLPPSSAGQIELANVPFFPQEDFQCGPAALATVLGAAGIARTPEQLAEQVYLPLRQGSLQVELLGASRRAGAVPYVLADPVRDLLREVIAGHPVLVLQDLGWLLPQWHYAVVIGHDLQARTLTLRSGPLARLEMPMDAFDRTWRKSGRWAFVALPPDRLPATAAEREWLASAAAFECVSPALGPQAYETALRAWPGSLFARLALGNAAYRGKQLDVARANYSQAAADHPGSADAWNNLAQVLLDEGRLDEAERAARRAVSIGGRREATYAATLAAVEAARARAR